MRLLFFLAFFLVVGFMGKFGTIRRRRQSLASAVILSLVGVLFSVISPFGIDDANSKHSGQILARLTAPFYPADPDIPVTVLMIDDESLKTNHMQWPMSHADWEEILSVVSFHKPSAIFIDGFYVDTREGTADLASFLTGPDHNDTWFYIASSDQAQRKPGALLGPIERCARDNNLQEVDDSTRKLNAAFRDRLLIRSSGYDGNYALYCRTDDGNIFLSPAARLFLDWKAEHQKTYTVLDFLHEQASAQEIVWSGVFTDKIEELHNPEIIAKCPNASDNFITRVRKFFNLLLQESVSGPARQSTCQPLTSISFHQWQQLNDDSAKEHHAEQIIKDRMVLIGIGVEGIQDEIETPVHGLLPGVMSHAMALDNLLNADALALSAPPDLWPGLSLANLVELFLFIGVIYMTDRLIIWARVPRPWLMPVLPVLFVLFYSLILTVFPDHTADILTSSLIAILVAGFVLILDGLVSNPRFQNCCILSIIPEQVKNALKTTRIKKKHIVTALERSGAFMIIVISIVAACSFVIWLFTVKWEYAPLDWLAILVTTLAFCSRFPFILDPDEKPQNQTATTGKPSSE